MITCTTLHRALLEWQKNIGVHPKVSKSKLNANRPDHLKYFNYRHDGGQIASCCPAIGRKLLNLPGVGDTYTFLTNTWNTLPENYQHRVYKNTFTTLKRQIQQAENSTPAMLISAEALHIDKSIFPHYLTLEVALEEPEIRRTDPVIPIDNTWMDDKLHFRITAGRGDYGDEGDESDKRYDIHTASQLWRAATDLERFDQATSDVDRYGGMNGDNADADAEAVASQANDGSRQHTDDREHSWFDLGSWNVDGYEVEDCDHVDEEEQASQADEGLMENVEDWGHSTRECEDWTVYFRPVKYDDGDANAKATDLSEAKTVLYYVTTSQTWTYMGKVWHPIYSNSTEVKCRTWLEKGRDIARHCVNCSSITAAHAKSVTHVMFCRCVSVTTFSEQSKRGTYAI